MIRVKCFEKNKDGKIEFTPDQLQELLNEVYESGREDEVLNHVQITYGKTSSPWFHDAPYWTTTSAVGTVRTGGDCMNETREERLEVKYGKDAEETTEA